ncbi:MAG: hypothetical protein A2086_09505 [Spirochaetes bacterium GWD1_27_9]|nr:MAG: hypothetical protein A2Z98_06065 [Spirochaetes bacterium GWB1_27_13]OHD29731.1 MAG: hypothetical protein A2086_09505 [Spirochaetes bacterium GWD1_27_9]
MSIAEVKNLIPADAISLLEETFNPALVNKILLAFRQKRNTTFRINTLKTTKQQVIADLQKEKFKIKSISFLPEVFYLDGDENNRLLKTDIVKEGKIYLQSISSLLPPLILEPQKNDKILDMAASPGSKTTQIAAIVANTGSIDAIEPDFVRMERLKHNVELLGVTNVNFYQTRGEDFCKDKKEYYDKILLDAPCSGEGRFNFYDKNSYGSWKKNNVEKLSNLQKKLLKSAVLATKINGIIVYSTCTLNVFENEKVIDYILKETDVKVKVVPIAEQFKTIPESVKPILQWKDEKFNDSIKNALRIIQSENIEGFFICKLKRVG